MNLHKYYYTSQIEFAWMILENARYSGRDIGRYMPYIESALTFFNEHYQYLARKRTGKPFDENGKLVFEPSKALETYQDCKNPTDVVTGLTVVLQRLLELPDTLVPVDRKTHWKKMLTRLPSPVNFVTYKERKVLVPAEKYGGRSNDEIPQLYPLFPYNTYGIGRPDLQTAIDTWQLGGPGIWNDKRWHCWSQCGIFTARMGLTDEARYYAVAKFSDSGRRFPAFWGPFMDYPPDHDHGGSGMVGLQEMLLQETGDDLYLFPAWPLDWDVHFKLHAPMQTIVEGSLHRRSVENLQVTIAATSDRKMIRLHTNRIGQGRITGPQGKAVSFMTIDENTLEFPVKAGQTFVIDGISAVPVPGVVNIPLMNETFESIKIEPTGKSDMPGAWQQWVYDPASYSVKPESNIGPTVETVSLPGYEGKSYAAKPLSLLSYDFGRRIRGVVSIKAFVRPDTKAFGVMEITNDNIEVKRFDPQILYRDLMMGVYGQSAWQYFSVGDGDQVYGIPREWRPIGQGQPLSADWVQITLDVTEEGFVGITVTDLATGKTEQSRIKAVEFVNGFRYLRLGSYWKDGGPVYFDDLVVTEKSMR
jgi:hypothetical protein